MRTVAVVLGLALGAGSCALVGDFDFDDWQQGVGGGGASAGGSGAGGGTGATGTGGGGATGGQGGGSGGDGGSGGSGGDLPDGYLPDSPTELCSDGTFVACDMVGVYGGQDGNHRIDVPSYSTSGDVVTDSISELRWQRVSQSGTSSASAGAFCSALAPLPDCDWRVPDLVELLTLVDYGSDAPALDSAFAEASVHRSSSLDGGDAWGIDFDTGQTALVSEGAAARVRCVCGTSPDSGYTPNDPVVVDERTGLVWEDGQQFVNLGWDFQLESCNSHTAAGLDWRLPSIKELASIFDPTDPTPPKLDDVFEFTFGRYASSTPVAGDPSMVWSFDYNTGAIAAEPIANGPSLSVRCVSGPEVSMP